MTKHTQPNHIGTRQKLFLALTGVCLGAVAVAAAVITFSGVQASAQTETEPAQDAADPPQTESEPAQDAAEPVSAATRTAAVEVRDLVETVRLSGTVGYDDELVITSRLAGTVTSLVKAGTEIGRGDELYRVDEAPVLALYGESGAWRSLEPGVKAGADVRQLETNLAALGHDPDNKLTIDDTWDAATTAAVKRWQNDLGVAQTGKIGLGQVVFVPGGGHIAGSDLTRGMAVMDGATALRFQPHDDVDTVVGYRTGNITTLAPVGTRLEAGTELYSVNTNSTYALIGDNVTNNRTLKKGVSDGTDIRALEQNLVAMGFDPDSEVNVDQKWDDATGKAVDRWLDALGLDEEATTTPALFQFIEPGQVVTGHLAEVGDETDDPAAVIEAGQSLRSVKATLNAADQELVATGDTISIVMPDGTETPGVVGEIATSTTANDDGSSSIELEIEPLDPAGMGTLVNTQVRIQVERLEAEAALAIPTASVLGLVQGGHAVEVVRSDGSTQLVQVELGRTADGWVEVTAGAVSEGDQIVMPL